MNDIEQTGELNVIKQYIDNQDVVFDVGANLGNWSAYVIEEKQHVNLHLFEPIPELYNKLKDSLGFLETIHINNIAVSDIYDSDKSFYYYTESSGLSTLHRRLIAEPKYHIKPPTEIKTDTISIDLYCEFNDINKINFLKIDTEGGEYNVLKGAHSMLKNNKINYIQFEYGECYLESKTTLQEVCSYISGFDYTLYKIQPNNIIPIKEITENYTYSNYLLTNNHQERILR